MSGLACTSHVAFAVDQVSSTLAFFGRWEPEMVIGIPATPSSGSTRRIPMVGLGRAELATGPGSALTPGIAGDRSVVKLTLGEAACADDGAPRRLPAVAALAVAAQENRIKAPANTPISTLRGLCCVKYLIVEFPLHVSWMVGRLERAASAVRPGDDHNGEGRMAETFKARGRSPAVR